MASDQHYDVIIIGIRSRRRDAGSPPGTDGQAGPAAGARRVPASRKGQLGFNRRLRHGQVPAPEFWLDQHGNEFPPEVNYYVGGNTKFYGAALFRLRPEDFGSFITTGACRRRGRSTTTNWSPTTRRPSICTSCTAITGGPDRGRGERAIRIRAGAARAAHSAAERRPREAGTASVPPADRRKPDAGRDGLATRGSACIRCDRVDGFPCLVHAKSDAQVICVDPALAHDNV